MVSSFNTDEITKDIYQRLNLMDPGLFRNFRQEQNRLSADVREDEERRQTGRTTWLLVRSISSAMRGSQVCLVSNMETYRAADLLFERLKKMLTGAKASYVLGPEEREVQVGLGRIKVVEKRSDQEKIDFTWSYHKDEV